MDDLPDLVPFPSGSPSGADVEQFMAELPALLNVSIGGAAGAQIRLFCQMPVWKQYAVLLGFLMTLRARAAPTRLSQDWDVTTTMEHAIRDAARACVFNPEAPRYHGIRPLVVLEAAGLLQELDRGPLVKERLIQEASKAINNQRTYLVQLRVLRGNDGNDTGSFLVRADQHAQELHQLKISNADQYSAQLQRHRDQADQLMADTAAGLDNTGAIAAADVDDEGLAVGDLVAL
ncbi:hypothetical protein RI367_003429 [Sorochytrium milnesiophthora]